MSDLIDFGSPDEKSKNPSLAMPLIPAPQSPSSEPSSSIKNDILIPCDVKPSTINNPFDKILNETVEYNQKKGDPFENIMQKAMKSRSSSFRSSREVNNDNLIRHSKYSDSSKMNKTLDNYFTASNFAVHTKIPVDPCSPSKTKPNINICPASPSSANLSILNYSAMNDSLSEASSAEINSKQENKKNVDHILSRSVLQENFLRSSNKCQSRRSLSVTDVPSNNLNSVESNSQTFPSFVFEDPLNLGFRKASATSSDKSNVSNSLNAQAADYSLRSYSRDRFPESDTSAFSQFSNISSIPKIPSASSFNSSSSVFSNGPMNRAYIGDNLNIKPSKYAEERNIQSVSDISDLKKKYMAIKARMSQSLMSNDLRSDSSLLKDTNDARNKSDFIVDPFKKPQEKLDTKLIDVDVFVPDPTPDLSTEQSSSSISHSSSDDVLVVNKKLDKSILLAARTLAKTFEELADDHSKSSDDLFLNDSRYNIELMPLSDNDTTNGETVDNLIELNISPMNMSEGKLKSTYEKINSNQINSRDSVVKEFEKEFVEPKDKEERAMATTVLLDLQKLIKADNNPEAAKILKDLENMLGVKCESNTDILTACLETTNLAAESPKILNNQASITPENDVEAGKKEKTTLDSSENSIKESKQTIVHNKTPDKKISNTNNKSPLSPMSSPDNNVEVVQNSLSKSDVSESTPDNEKLAKDILQALTKILNGESKVSSDDLLKNLGTVLNLNTDNNSNRKQGHRTSRRPSSPKSKSRLDSQKKELSLTPSMNKSASFKNLHPSHGNKLSEKTLRRSSSAKKVTDEKSEHDGTFVRNNKSASSILDSGKRRSSLSNSLPSKTGPLKSPIKPLLPRRSTIRSKDVEEKSRLLEMPKQKLVENIDKPVFKKKSGMGTVPKKGPMKAVLPLGNMQRRGSFGRKVVPIDGLTTPPKTSPESLSVFTVPSSTPNSDKDKHMKKTPKPKATSTPDVICKNTPNYKLCNISPVSFNSHSNSKLNSSGSSQGSLSMSGSLRRSFRVNKSTSPQKTPQKTPRAQKMPNSPDSRLPRLTPRRGMSQNFSSDDVKIVKSTETYQGLQEVPKTPNTKVDRESIPHPLRNSNKVNSPKLKPFNLISKLRGRGSSSSKIQMEKEKENHYN